MSQGNCVISAREWSGLERPKSVNKDSQQSFLGYAIKSSFLYRTVLEIDSPARWDSGNADSGARIYEKFNFIDVARPSLARFVQDRDFNSVVKAVQFVVS